MTTRVDARDRQLLGAIAEHRALTVSQAAAPSPGQRNVRGLRRRLRGLEEGGLIQVTPAPLGKRRGRPEGIASLTNDGVEYLRNHGILSRDLPDDQVRAERLPLRHQLLVNDFRVMLAEMVQLAPGVAVRFLAPTSPSVARVDGGRPLVCERFEDPDHTGGWIDFTPDGVLMMTHAEEDRPLLFFLEADMGTETLASPKRRAGDFRQKILNYHATYRLGRYKRYEQVWGCGFRGFRLLVLTHSGPRMASLCRLVRDMPPSDYIYLADRQSMLTEGVWAEVWVKGGGIDRRRHSILGTRLPRPVPAPGGSV